MPPPYPPENLYTILGLPSPTTTTTTTPGSPHLTTSQIKAAYRRALLTAHPDKTPATPAAGTSTIDTITLARTVLTDPAARRAYDRHLALQPRRNDGAGAAAATTTTTTETETLDLDDMVHDAARGTWWRGCRCGEGGGFVVREEELEDAGGEEGVGEVLVGCKGCSLVVRVVFAVVVEEEGDGGGGGGSVPAHADGDGERAVDIRWTEDGGETGRPGHAVAAG